MEISKVEEELNKLKEQLGGIDQENMKGEKRQLQTKYTNLTKEVRCSTTHLVKRHVALDQASWSMKSDCNRLL